MAKQAAQREGPMGPPPHLPRTQWGLPPRMRKTPPTEAPLGTNRPGHSTEPEEKSELVTVSDDTANKTQTHPADRYRRLLIETCNVILHNMS